MDNPKPLIALLCMECRRGAMFIMFGKSLCELCLDKTIAQAKIMAENMRKVAEKKPKIQTA